MSTQDVGADGWRTSSRSTEGANCVEVRFRADDVEIRDSKNRNGPLLAFTHAEWQAFVDGTRDGEFDLPSQSG